MVGVVVLTFLICWFPFALMFAGSPFSDTLATFFNRYKIEASVTWLGKEGHITIYNPNNFCPAYTNSCLNPVIYAAMNTGIRRGMVAVVKRVVRHDQNN